MKIVYDHQIFIMQEHGGVSRYFVELAKELDTRASVDLTLLAPLYCNRYLEDANLNATFGFKYQKFPNSHKLTRIANDLITHRWLTKNEPDIIHATYYFPIRGQGTSKSKVVITVYDMIHELFPDNFLSHDQTMQLKHDAIKKADHIICISNNTRNDLIRFTDIDPNKVSMVHLGANLIMPASGAEFGGPVKPYLLFVGQRSAYKNFSNLLKTFADSHELNAQFTLACFGGGKFTKKELYQQKRLGLNNDQVMWFGGGDSVLAWLYKNASALIYPSLYEGFGMPPLEAMSFNCPVICSNGGSIPEVVGEAGEFFDPHNPSDILRAIERVVNDNLYTTALRLKGIDQLEKFSWSQCAKETLKVYRSLF